MSMTMFVFYDDKFEIRSISPSAVPLSENLAVSSFPLSEVQDFLLGKKNTLAYKIEKYETVNGEAIRIIEKPAERIHARTETSFLSKIESATKDALLAFRHDYDNKKFKVMSTPLLQDKFNNGTEAEQESLLKIFSDSVSVVYVTSENNPYNLLCSFEFNPRSILENNPLTFRYTDTYNVISFYTKKITSGYVYLEKG